MGTAQKQAPQKGWLGLAFGDGVLARKWVVLDNGVLWVHRDHAEQLAAEQVIPLHDAEVQFSSSPITTTPAEPLSLDMLILLGTGMGARGRFLRMRPDSEEEYRRWTSAMMEAAQLWHSRRQMAFMAVLPGAAADPADPTASGHQGHQRASASSPGSVTSIAEGRRLVLGKLSHFLVQVGELRGRTRRAVTRTQRHCDPRANKSAVGADLNLPRFLRRAIADAVEKIWRACGRAYACADVLDDGENGDPLAVYDGVLVLREAVHAFVTYCSLLRDLQAMLRDGEGQSESEAEDPLPYTPLRCLSSLRDTLAVLSALIRCPEEEARQRAALAAVDATLQRCWTELSKRPLDQDLSCDWTSTSDKATSSEGSSTIGPPSPPSPSDAGDNDDRGSTSSLAPCVPFRGSSSVRRLASKLQRDVVRTSVKRARKRARTEGQALLPDQPLDDSLEQADAAANALEMTVLTTASGSPTSSEASAEATPVPQTPGRLHRQARPQPQTPVMVPVTPVAASAPAAQRLGRSAVGGSLAALNVNLCSPKMGQRRYWQDPALLRRRRLVCSAADCDTGGVDTGDADKDSDVFESAVDDRTSGAEKVKDTRASSSSSSVALRQTAEADREWDQDSVRGRRAASVREDLGVLDVPVTPATPNGGGRRALWCETMEVQRSGLLDRLNTSESALQEAKFEVLSSEESYLRSLDMLAHRVQAIDALQDPCVISDQERDAVTKFLDTARACSMRFVSALRALWSLDVMLRGLCTLMHKEAMPAASLQQYVLIVSLQPRVASVLGKIGSLEASQLVPLLSLPAQRASRLPLLLAAILRRLDQRTSEAVICRAALDRLNQIVFECNEALRRAEQTERMAELGRILRVEKSSPRKQSWSERKNNVIGRAKSFFLKSNSRIGSKTSKILTSTSSMLHLT